MKWGCDPQQSSRTSGWGHNLWLICMGLLFEAMGMDDISKKRKCQRLCLMEFQKSRVKWGCQQNRLWRMQPKMERKQVEYGDSQVVIYRKRRALHSCRLAHFIFQLRHRLLMLWFLSRCLHLTLYPLMKAGHWVVCHGIVKLQQYLGGALCFTLQRVLCGAVMVPPRAAEHRPVPFLTGHL